MTLGDIATKARDLTNTDTTGYPDAKLLININIWYQKVADMIFGSQDDSDFDEQRTGGSAGSTSTYPIQTTSMVANQRDYTMPVSERMLKLKRVDVCYDGSNAYRAAPFDTGSFPGGIKFDNSSSTDATFDQNFIQQEPKYDWAYGSLWIIPMPTQSDVDNGGFIRTEWQRGVIPFTSADYTSVLTDSTQVPGFDAPFHAILAYGAAFEYAASKQLPQLSTIQPMLQDYETRLRQAYGRKDLDTRLALQHAYDNYSFR